MENLIGTGNFESDTFVESTTDSIAENTFSNPLLKSGPDPWAIFHEGNYNYIKSGW